MEFRYARHTNNIKVLVDFYTGILNFEELFAFNNHNGYSGAFVGKPSHDWHLEFTQSDTPSQHSFDEDDVLVFYPKTEIEYIDIVRNIESNKIAKIKAKNPFWNENGITIEDPDGFKVIISPLKVDS